MTEKGSNMIEIYSERQKRLRGEFPDVYQYEDIPKKLRIKIYYSWQDVWEISGTTSFTEYSGKILKMVEGVLCRKYGVFQLPYSNFLEFSNYPLWRFFHQTENTEEVLDVIELLFQYLFDPNTLKGFGNSKSVVGYDILCTRYNEAIEKAVLELNKCFRDHGVGYQYDSGQIIRVDSQYIHSEAVRPVLNLLSDSMYESANKEFLKAHEYYRKGDYKSCIQECSNAFESVLKVICDNKGWEYNDARVSTLLKIVYDNGLIPTYQRSFFDGIRGSLQSGVPAIRNNLSAHGQGIEEVVVPYYMAECMLNLTASSILFLVRANKEAV